MLLAFGVEDCHAVALYWLEQDTAEVDALGLPVVQRLAHVQHVHAADHLVQRAEAQLGHDLAQLLRHEEEVVDHMLRLAGEARAQHRVLRRHAHRAGVQVALAHHDAAGRDQWRGRKAELIGAE